MYLGIINQERKQIMNQQITITLPAEVITELRIAINRQRMARMRTIEVNKNETIRLIARQKLAYLDEVLARITESR